MLQELPVEDVVPIPLPVAPAAAGAQAPASRRFTRVTFAGPTGRADVSVPDDLPAALVIEQVRPLLDAAAGDRWVLTRPAGGDLGPEDTLGEGGVLDGELLYLRRHGDGYLPPYAEDAAEEAAGAGPRAGTWTEDATRVVLATAAALWLGLAGPLLVWRFGPAAAATPVLVLVVALRAGAAAGAVAALPLARRQHGLGWAALIATVTVALAVQAWAGLAVAGLPAGRAAAVVGLALVACQSALPRVATELAGLGRLADAVADGGAVPGYRIRLAADQARELLAALLAGTGVAVALAVGLLAAGGGAPGTVL